MKIKIMLVFVTVAILSSVVNAGSITNFRILQNVSGFFSGEGTSAVFEFDYPDLSENYARAPLVSIINITSLDINYPVWKGDFAMTIVAQRYWLFGLIPIGGPIPMPCTEEAPVRFHPRDRPGWLFTIEAIPNGTFYCYNPDYYMLQLDSRTKLNLNISSRNALYPGQYEIFVGLYEMERDDEGPLIELVEPFEGQIFGGEELIPVKLNITDMYAIESSSVRYRITDFGIPNAGQGLNISYYDTGWLYNITYNGTSGMYESLFNMSEHRLNESGSYWFYARAKDMLGNEGEL